MVEEESGSEVFWQYLCSYQHLWRLLAIFLSMLGLLLAFALVFLKSDASYLLVLVDVVLIGTMLLSLIFVITRCKRRQREF